MFKPGAVSAIVFFAAAVISGCQSQETGPAWIIKTDGGTAAWDAEGSVSVFQQVYLDRGTVKNCLEVNADSQSVLELTGPEVTVHTGRPVSFSFAFRSEGAGGQLFSASLEFFDKAGESMLDTLLYRITATAGEGGPGYTRPWTEFTRVIKPPAGVSTARISLACRPERGRVWLGETSLTHGEGWLAYAAGFSRHLGRYPEDKYVYTAARVIEPESVPAPSENELAAGMIFFERKGFVGAWPYANPRAGDRVKVLYEKVPRGAVAPFAFAVKALEDLSRIRASVTIPPVKENITLKTKPVLYLGRYAATRHEGSWSRVFGVRARLLETPKEKSLLRGENLFYWLDLPVPPNTPAGIYNGEITVQAAGRDPLIIPFSVEVAPIDLPALPENQVVGFYYYPPDDPSLIETHFKDMAARGVNGISLAGSFVEKSPSGRVRLDWERVQRLDRIMALMRRYRLFRPTSLYVAGLIRRLELPRRADDWTDEHRELFAAAIKLMDDTARRRGWCKLMFFPVDEPANSPEDMKLAHLTLGLLRSIKGIVPLCDLNTPSSVEELSPYLDAVVIQISSVSPRTVDPAKQRGLKVFFYLPAFGSSDVGGDAAYHRAIPGWFLPRSGADGIYYFAYQSVEQDPYDELDGSHRDWCAAYPSPDPDNIWPSPEWQGIRRGIEDLRLVTLARELIERGKAGDDSQLNRLAADAERRLNGIIDSVKPSGPEVIYQLHYELETYISEKWRQELLDQVSLLQKVLEH